MMKLVFLLVGLLIGFLIGVNWISNDYKKSRKLELAVKKSQENLINTLEEHNEFWRKEAKEWLNKYYELKIKKVSK